jgi:hypothetical protein
MRKLIYALIIIVLFATPVMAEGYRAPLMYGTSYDGLPFVRFNLNETTTCVEGMIKWNDDDKTMDICTENGEVTIQAGQEMHVRGTNKSGSTLTNGQVVYIDGAQGFRPTFAIANATSEDTSSKVIGIVTADILDNATGYVTTTGLVRDINTSALAAGEVAWLSATPGGFTNSMPGTPNHAVSLGVVVRSSADEGIIYVTTINGFELWELHDVATIIQNAVTYDLLQYDGAAWTNSSDLVVNSITYNNTYWEDKTISIVSTVLGPTAPDLETFIQNTLAYAWSDTTASEAAHLNVQTPHAKKLSTDLDAHVHGNPGSNTNSGNVEAILECTDLVNMDGTFPNSTTVYNTVIAVDGTAYKNYYSDFGAVDGSGATKVSALMQCRLTRNVSTAGDLTGDFFFLDVDFHYQIDTPGSETEDAK